MTDVNFETAFLDLCKNPSVVLVSLDKDVSRLN